MQNYTIFAVHLSIVITCLLQDQIRSNFKFMLAIA